MSEDNRANDELLAEMLDLAMAESKIDPMGYFERRGIPRDEARALFAGIAVMIAERQDAAPVDRIEVAAMIGFIVGWQFCAGRLAEAAAS